MLSVDREIEESEHRSPAEFFAELGEEAFRAFESNVISHGSACRSPSSSTREGARSRMRGRGSSFGIARTRCCSTSTSTPRGLASAAPTVRSLRTSRLQTAVCGSPAALQRGGGRSGERRRRRCRARGGGCLARAGLPRPARRARPRRRCCCARRRRDGARPLRERARRRSATGSSRRTRSRRVSARSNSRSSSGSGTTSPSTATARSSRSAAARPPTRPASPRRRTCVAFPGWRCRRRSSVRWTRRSAARQESTPRTARTSPAHFTGRRAS